MPLRLKELAENVNIPFSVFIVTITDMEALFEKSNIEKPDEVCKLVNHNPIIEIFTVNHYLSMANLF